MTSSDLCFIGKTLPKIEFEIVIIFAKINDDVTGFKAVDEVSNYLGKVFDSQYSATHQFDEVFDFFEPALVNSVVNL